jgi:hypothetical protein
MPRRKDMKEKEEQWQSEIWPILKRFEDKSKETGFAYKWECEIGDEYFRAEYNGLSGRLAFESSSRCPKANP